MIAPNPQGQPATMSPGQANQLTSYLYGLKTPEAVQAYAAQHQNDINVVGIASGVANAMKRAQQQAVPQQPQPSVTQQTIAQMAPRAQMPQQMPQQAPQMAPQGQMPQQAPQLPENSGIGQLPVPSMQSMAGGGITGEARDVPRFARGVYMGATPGIEYGNYGSPGAPNQGVLPDASGYEGMGLGEMLSAMGSDASNAMGNLVGQERWNEWTRSRNAPDQDYNYGNEGMRQAAPITNLPTTQPMPTGAGQGVRGVPAAPVAGAGQGSRGTAANPATTGLQLLANAPAAKALNPALATKPMETHDFDFYKKKMLEASTDPVETQYNDIQANVRNLQEAAKAAGYDFENSKAFAQLQKLDDKSSELLDRKQNLAIIQAGLGMIRSGNPFEAIAAGAGQGLKSYGEALDQSQATQQKLAESRIALEQSKNAMAAGLFGKAAEYQLKGMELHHDAIKNSNTLAAGMSEADARNANAVAINNANIAKDYGVAGLHNSLMQTLYGNRSELGNNKLTEQALKDVDMSVQKRMIEWSKQQMMSGTVVTPEQAARYRATIQAEEMARRPALANSQQAVPAPAGRTIDFNTGKPI